MCPPRTKDTSPNIPLPTSAGLSFLFLCHSYVHFYPRQRILTRKLLWVPLPGFVGWPHRTTKGAADGMSQCPSGWSRGFLREKPSVPEKRRRNWKANAAPHSDGHATCLWLQSAPDRQRSASLKSIMIILHVHT